MLRQSHPMKRNRDGFTLVEMLFVVLILGVLAATVLASIKGSNREAENATFAKNLKTYITIFEMRYQRTGAYPADATPGEAPAEMTDALGGTNWTTPTPLGGQWDWDENVFGVTAGISVYQPNRTDADMTEIDRLVDDGDLTTGSFRSRSDGYIYVMAW